MTSHSGVGRGPGYEQEAGGAEMRERGAAPGLGHARPCLSWARLRTGSPSSVSPRTPWAAAQGWLPGRNLPGARGHKLFPLRPHFLPWKFHW